jgi:hypothetical protein
MKKNRKQRRKELFGSEAQDSIRRLTEPYELRLEDINKMVAKLQYANPLDTRGLSEQEVMIFDALRSRDGKNIIARLADESK